MSKQLTDEKAGLVIQQKAIEQNIQERKVHPDASEPGQVKIIARLEKGLKEINDRIAQIDLALQPPTPTPILAAPAAPEQPVVHKKK